MRFNRHQFNVGGSNKVVKKIDTGKNSQPRMCSYFGKNDIKVLSVHVVQEPKQGLKVGEVIMAPNFKP